MKKQSVDIAVRNIGEIIMNSVKTKKQVSDNSAGASFRDSVEIPFTVGLGLYMHQQTRSKNIINTLLALKLSIPYDKVLQIETAMASSIAGNMDKNEIYHQIFAKEFQYILQWTIQILQTIPLMENDNSMVLGNLYFSKTMKVKLISKWKDQTRKHSNLIYLRFIHTASN